MKQFPQSSDENTSINELLWKAFLDSDIRLFRQLIRDGADVNGRNPTSSETLLTSSINDYEGDLEVIHILLDSGADTNMRGSGGFTPLALAIAGGLIEVVKLLLDHGADINGQSGMLAWTPLMEAVDHEQTLIFKYLVSRGADPRVRNQDREDLYKWAQEAHIDLNRFFA